MWRYFLGGVYVREDTVLPPGKAGPAAPGGGLGGPPEEGPDHWSARYGMAPGLIPACFYDRLGMFNVYPRRAEVFKDL